MKALTFLVCGILTLTSAGALSQAQSDPQSQPSSAQSYGVKVYSSQGYYVKAKNFNSYTCYYSFTYVIKGYDNKGDLVSETEETKEDLKLEANEASELFTTPTDQEKKITYWITITKVWGVRKED